MGVAIVRSVFGGPLSWMWSECHGLWSRPSRGAEAVSASARVARVQEVVGPLRDPGTEWVLAEPGGCGPDVEVRGAEFDSWAQEGPVCSGPSVGHAGLRFGGHRQGHRSVSRQDQRWRQTAVSTRRRRFCIRTSVPRSAVARRHQGRNPGRGTREEGAGGRPPAPERGDNPVIGRQPYRSREHIERSVAPGPWHVLVSPPDSGASGRHGHFSRPRRGGRDTGR